MLCKNQHMCGGAGYCWSTPERFQGGEKTARREEEKRERKRKRKRREREGERERGEREKGGREDGGKEGWRERVR